MAQNQTELHRLGRTGEMIVSKMVEGQITRHKAPFDIVDFGQGKAYEVKTMSGLSKDLKIHISPASMARKKGFARRYGLKAILIVVIIYDENTIKVYRGSLKSSIRVNQMKEVK